MTYSITLYSFVFLLLERDAAYFTVYHSYRRKGYSAFLNVTAIFVSNVHRLHFVPWPHGQSTLIM